MFAWLCWIAIACGVSKRLVGLFAFFCYSRLITFIYWRVTELHRRRAEKGFCFYGHVLCWFLITIFRRANLFDKRERDFDTYLDT